MQYEEFCSYQNVSRETFAQLEKFVMHLEKWQKPLNLISRQSTDDIWQRHVVDSIQLYPRLPKLEKDAIAVDLGTGGGFPGLILAILTPELQWKFVESDRKKAIFLREAALTLGLENVEVLNERIEAVVLDAFVITSRALATVSKLLTYVEKMVHKDTVCLFLKGKNWQHEITEAEESWNFHVEDMASQTSEEGRVLIIKDIAAKV